MNQPISSVIFLKCLLFLLLILPACNTENNSKNTKDTIPSLSGSDQQLMNNVYQNLLLSTKLAEEAINRSTTQETKDLAKSILNEHQQMMGKIEVIAGKHAATLPMDISPVQVKEWQSVVREKGIAFDKYYAQTVQANHTNNNKAFSLLKNATNQGLQALATNFINTSLMHIQQGNELLQVLNNRRSRDTVAIVEEEVSENQ